MKIFITRDIPSVGIEFLKKKGYEVSVYKKDNPLSKNELLKSVNNCDGLISM